MSAGPTILVIGRSGQLATALACTGNATIVTAGRPGFDFAAPDAPSWLLDQIRPAAVINAAAYTSVDRAESRPEPAFALNHRAPAALAQACARNRLPLIHVSTDCVFDGAKPGAYLETDEARPLNVYGRSKRAGEEAVLNALPSALVVRTSWIFGHTGENFVVRVLGWARRRSALTIVGDQRGRPTYAPALAAALLTLAQRMAARDPSTPAGLLHLAGASLLSRAEQAQMVLDASAARGGPWASVTPIPTSRHPTPARRPLNAALDCSLAARHGSVLGPFGPDLQATLDRLIGPADAAVRQTA